MILQGADKHDILGQCVSTLDHAVSFYVIKLAEKGTREV